MKCLFAPNITDGYKLGHPSQYVKGTESVTANFTPRSAQYARVTEFGKTDKMVWIGISYACQEYLINVWNDTFFSKPKEKVIARYVARIERYLGPGQGKAAIKMMEDIHDLGYLPLRIKALPEGSRVNPGIPVFTITNSIKDSNWDTTFHALVNYVETVLSTTIWPMCNSASLVEQYYLLAKYFGELTGASPEYWLPFAAHNFALRGHRGVEDGVMSAFGHSMFFNGTDSFIVEDFIDEYYPTEGGRVFASSVNATEHATVCQRIAFHNGDEQVALKEFITEVYPDGIISYVADADKYWNVVTVIVPALKDVILARKPRADGQPAVLTLRPDSSPKTPYEIIMGDREGLDPSVHVYDMTPQQKGTLQCLWETFGGELVTGSNGKQYKLLDSHVRVIYGEAIPLEMAEKIYSAMEEQGWCVGNLFFGIGSWAFLKDSSRDSYGCATKATNSEVKGKEVPMQKTVDTSSYKQSARGRLRVEFNGEKQLFELFQNQTPEQEEQGQLQDVFLNSQMLIKPTAGEIRDRLGVPY